MVLMSILVTFFLSHTKIFKSTSNTITRNLILKEYRQLKTIPTDLKMPNTNIKSRKLKKIRERLRHEMYIRNGLLRSVFTIFELWLLCSICYSSRDDRSYNIHDSITNTIINASSYRGPNFHEIRTMKGYVNWVYYTAFPALFPEKDYTGQKLNWRERQYYSDLSKIRVGPPRFRQIRVKKEIVHIPFLNRVEIFPAYSFTKDDTGEYCINWNPKPCDIKNETYSFSTRGWKYTSASDVWGVPIAGHHTTYNGGGYIAELDVNLDFSNRTLNELKTFFWFDRQTRAVFLEFSLYSANLNMFCYVLLIAEFLETGGVDTMSSIYPLKMYHHHGSIGAYMMLCGGLYVIILLAKTVRVVYSMCKRRRMLWQDITQVLDFMSVILGFIALAMYIGRLVLANYTMQKYKTDPKNFVDFQHIILLDLLFGTTIGCLLFFSTIRLVCDFGSNKQFKEALAILKNRSKDLYWNGILLFFIITIYAMLGFLLFGHTLKEYRDVLSSIETLFVGLIGKHYFKAIVQANPALAHTFFCTYIFFLFYIMLNIFMAILGESISTERLKKKKDNTGGLIEYLISVLKNVFDLGEMHQHNTEPVKITDPLTDIFRELRTDLRHIVDQMDSETSDQTGTKIKQANGRL